MSTHLQPLVPLVTLVKIEPPTVIKNEPPEEALEEKINTDVKEDIDIVYHPLSEDLIKSETDLEDILDNKHLEAVQTQVLMVKAENSPFIKTENITQRNKSEDTSDGNVNKSSGQGIVEVQASNEHSNALSNVEIDEKSVLNFSKDLNSISVRSRKSESPKKTDFAECYKTDDTTLWKKEKEKIMVIQAPVIPVEEHEYTSLAKDKHVCNHCQHACNTLNNLKRHIKRMHRKVTTMYQCPYCPYKSKWKHYMKQHIIQKHKDTKDIEWFQCNLCEMKFKLKKSLTQHMKNRLKHKHMQDGLDLYEKSVEAHEYTSFAKDRHVCNHCQHAFNTLGNLKKHIEKIHREVTTMYQCPYCSYKSKWSVREHIIQKHKDTKDIEWFQCNLCEIKFKLKGDLTKHMKKVHLKHKQKQDMLVLREKRYHCNNCDYKTDHHYILKRHKLVHLKSEEIEYFYCYHCSYKSKRKFDLKNHIFRYHFKNVKQGKRYDYNKCDFETFTSTQLKRHNLIYRKPEEIEYFYCYHCSYKTKRKDNLKEHIFTHFKKEQVKFDCYICNFMTPKRESIIKHIKKHSKVQNKSEINE